MPPTSACTCRLDSRVHVFIYTYGTYHNSEGVRQHMAYNTVEQYTYNTLYAYLHRAYKRNEQGGPWRNLGSIARADYYPNGSEGAGAEITISWYSIPLVTLTIDGGRVHPLQYVTKPMLKMLNRVLEDSAPGHSIAYDKFAVLQYEGHDVFAGFSTGWYFNGKFYEINGRNVLKDYRDDYKEAI